MKETKMNQTTNQPENFPVKQPAKEDTFIMKPKIDFCFKELMENPTVRQGFLSALLDVAPEKITSSVLLPTHLHRDSADDKLGILDVRVLLNGKEQVDMEIQIAPFAFWAERSLFYLCKMYTGQIKAGEGYETLQKCIHVGILDFTLFAEDPSFYSRFHLWEDSHRKLFSDKLEIHILELPKLRNAEEGQSAREAQRAETAATNDTESLQSAANQASYRLLNWARFINAEKKEELKMLSKTDPYLNEAYNVLEHISADELKRLEYEAREKAIRDHNHLLRSNREQGREEGLEEGKEMGIHALINICRKFKHSREETLTSLCEEFNLSPEEAEQYLLKYRED